MLIILEGTDGAGKSTLAGRLTDAAMVRGWSVEVLHAGPPRPETSVFKQYSEPLMSRRDDVLRHDHLLVLDRWHLGELIYGPLLRGKSLLEPEQFAHLELMLSALGAHRVVVRAYDSELMERLGTHREDLVDVRQAMTINHEFGMLALEHDWDLVFPTDVAPRLLVADLLGHARRRTAAVQGLAEFPGYVGPPEPGLLLVGDEPSGWTAGDPARPAFYPDVRGSSSSYLLRSLIETDRRAVFGMCNANDGTDVKTLYSRLGCPLVVALGRRAQTALDRLGYTYVDVPHPQWVRRFHHASRAEYGKSILYPDLTLRSSGDDLRATPSGRAN